MKRLLLPLVLLLSCKAANEPAGNALGQYEFDPPGDVRPVDDWGEMMAESYADSLAEVEQANLEFARWVDSMKLVTGK